MKSKEVLLLGKSLITTRGLYLTNYAFNPLISAKGDCIEIYKGFIFVVWYRGDMSDRHVMLSRSEIGNGLNKWVHIEFPHRHIGFRGNSLVGYSHNIIAIGISPINDSIHLIYDLHAYGKNKYPDDHFNYSHSIDGAALVNDEKWSIDLFYPKQTYLNPGYNYQIMTYPAFMTTSAGLLIAKFRYGGPYNANEVLNVFDGSKWSSQSCGTGLIISMAFMM